MFAEGRPTMTIFPPMVVGPISECNASVIVNNLRTGSTVSIFSGGTRIGGGIASFPVELFQLTAPLTAGQLVHARQELAGETSAPVPFENRTRVQPAPADMSSSFVQVGSIVYECGNCLQISSAVP